MILYKDCSSHLDSSKNMATRGRGLFSLYIYIENFKNLLVRNHWSDFNIFLQKCSFGDPLPKLFKPFGFVKNKAARGRGLFSLSGLSLVVYTRISISEKVYEDLPATLYPDVSVSYLGCTLGVYRSTGILVGSVYSLDQITWTLDWSK